MLNLSFEEAFGVVQPLAYFVLGITIYAIFVFEFYKFIAAKDIFKLDLSKYNTSNMPWLSKTVHALLYVFKYILLFPIFSFFWFSVLTVLLSLLAKNSEVETILLISMAVVGAIRVTAYYSEDLSKDLAKMLPFALLGVFLVDISFFSLSDTISVLYSVPDRLNLLIYYLGFGISLEFFMRLFYALRKKRQKLEEP